MDFGSLFQWFRRKPESQQLESRVPETTNQVHINTHSSILDTLLLRLGDAFENEPGMSARDLYNYRLPIYQALLKNHIYIPVPEDHQAGELLRLVTVNDVDGNLGIPVFTTADALFSWTQNDNSFASISFPALCRQSLESQIDFIVFNPAGPVSGELSAYEMCYLAEGLIPPANDAHQEGITLDRDTEIAIGKPANPPSIVLMERLSGFFHQNTDKIEAAYVFQVSISNGPSHLAMGIRMAAGFEPLWEKELLPNTIAISQEVLGKNEYLDFFILNQAKEIEESLKSFTMPFFKAATTS